MIREKNISDQIKNYFVDTTPSDFFFFYFDAVQFKIDRSWFKKKTSGGSICYVYGFQMQCLYDYSWLMQILQEHL